MEKRSFGGEELETLELGFKLLFSTSFNGPKTLQNHTNDQTK